MMKKRELLWLSGGVLGLALVLGWYNFSLSAQGAPRFGQFNYRTTCQPCHGMDGSGQGPAARLLPLEMPDWTKKKPYYFEKKEALLQKLRNLLGDDLRTHEKVEHYTSRLSASDLSSLAGYIKQHQGLEEGQYPEGFNKLYEKACFYCHGAYGDGKGMISGFERNPRNFREVKLQKYSQSQILALLRRSQKKKITIQKNIRHIPHALSEADLELVKSYIYENFR